MAVNSRRKGHSWERLVANELKDIGYKNAKRQLEYQEGLGVDIANVFPLRIQCKVGKSYNVEEALEQADRDAQSGEIAVAVCKKDNKKPTATIYWEDFKVIIELLKSNNIW